MRLDDGTRGGGRRASLREGGERVGSKMGGLGGDSPVSSSVMVEGGEDEMVCTLMPDLQPAPRRDIRGDLSI